MATKKIQLYRRNVDGTETLLNPLTKAKYVTMEDGSMVEEALTNQDSSKYTPNIESSKSVFKVGEGDGVDLSSSVVDGAYNSCVLKGRTLVNIAPVKYGFGDTKLLDEVTMRAINNDTSAESRIKPFYPVFKLKPNTTYAISLKITQLNNISAINSYVKFENGETQYGIFSGLTSVGQKFVRFTTDSREINEVALYLSLSTDETISAKIKEVMLFEYQEGMENWSVPSFTGMCDVKSPILSNIGETVLETPHEQEYGLDATREFFRIVDCAKTFDSFGANKPYTLSFDIKANKAGTARVYQQNSSGAKYLFAFEIPVGVEYTRHCVKVTPVLVDMSTEESWLSCFTTYDSGCFATVKNVRISTGLNDEPYKSNILTCDTYFDEASQSDKTIVLRSISNEIYDTLNVGTGEYAQRISEVVLDGSHSGAVLAYADIVKETTLAFKVPYNKHTGSWINGVGKCDKLPFVDGGTIYNGDKECICTDSTGIIVRLLKSKCTDVVSFNSYLQGNPLTVQIPLKEAIAKTINLSGFPYAYKDGHVILSSGSVEPSLTPKIEYSLVANQNGQIEANTKRVLAHQKELDDFEALMLTQMVQSHYEKTLLQFDYEMSMMALKGE